MAVLQKFLSLRPSLCALSLLALTACSESPKPNCLGPNDFQVGRFRIVHVPGSNETIEIDTANGKTWRLGSDSTGGVRWEKINDL